MIFIFSKIIASYFIIFKRLFKFYPGDDLLSHPGIGAVPSARMGLTALFEMGRGVSPLPESPDNCCGFRLEEHREFAVF
jgi:hypothetical protein